MLGKGGKREIRVAEIADRSAMESSTGKSGIDKEDTG